MEKHLGIKGQKGVFEGGLEKKKLGKDFGKKNLKPYFLFLVREVKRGIKLKQKS